MSESRRRRVVDVGKDGGPTPQQQLDAPGAHAQELDAKVHVFRSGKHPTFLDELIRDSPDPFDELYESFILNPDTGEPDSEKLDAFAKAHHIEEWLKSREDQRGRLLMKAEEENGGEPLSIEKQEEVLISHALEVEDDRAGVVETVSRNLVIEPPFHPAVLQGLTTTNNTLNPLVGAMEVNVAGTGWELLPVNTFEMAEAVEDEIGNLNAQEREAKDAAALAARQAAEDEFDGEVAQQREGLEGFFKEPWPGTSWTTMERRIRRDMEQTGNAYIEVIRNLKGEIMLARRIDPKLMRLVRLDDPILVEKELKRGGQDVTVKVPLRERRFVEQVGGGAIIPRFRQSPSTAGIDPSTTTTTLGPNTGQTTFFAGQGIRIIYFKEFGASRDLDMWLGTWAQEGEVIPFERRATEIIHRTVNESHRTPYGLPRWINEMPAVLGSRKAEEFNLAFFDAGGVPPMLITIAGGQMAEKAHDALDKMMNTRNPASKHQAIVLEITGAGRMDKNNPVKVSVERFGSERTQDSLFQKYDERTSDLVRMSFRLPPVFLGDADAHNFNTVKSSYLVAEAQVFQPERDESDEIVTMKVLRNMPNGENFRFHSLPLVVDDTSEQIQCIEVVADGGFVPGEQVVQAINKVCGLEFQFDQAQQDKKEAQERERMDALRGMAQRGGPPAPGEEEEEPATGSADDEEEEVAKVVLKKIDGYVALGIDLAEALAKGVATRAARADLKKNLVLFEELAPAEKETVERIMALRALGDDSDSIREIFGCSAAILASNAEGEPEPEQA